MRSIQFTVLIARLAATAIEVGSHFTSWVNWPIDTEVASARSVAEHEVVGSKLLLHDVEQSFVGALDDRLVQLGRSDELAAPDLAGGDVVVHLLGLVAVHLQVPRHRQELAGLVDVVLIGPPVVVHRLGDPFVAVVLDQGIDERQRRIGGHHTAAGELAFEAHDLRRRVDGGFAVAAVVGRVDDRPG